MTLASNFYTCLTQTNSLVTNLGLTWPPTSGVVPVVTRKLPKAEEVLDAPLPILAIAPGPKPERVGYPCGTYVEVDYPVQIVLISAGNANYTSNLDIPPSWRQAIRRVFQAPRVLVGVIPGQFDTTLNLDALLDRSELNSLYDYTAMEVRFSVLEPQT